jgi:hypothetical protein
MLPAVQLSSTLILLCALGCGRLDYEAIGLTDPIHAEVDDFQTTSLSFVDVEGGTLEVPAGEGKPWLLLVSAALQSTYSGAQITSVEARYLVDETERGIGGADVSGRTGCWQHLDLLYGVSESRRVQVQLRDATSSLATIQNLRIVLVSIPSSADLQVALDRDEPQTAAAGSWTDIQTLTLAPDVQSRYLILAVANGSEQPGSSAGLRLEFDGEFWPFAVGSPEDRRSYWSNPRDPWLSMFLAREVALNEPKTVRLLATAGSGSSTFRYARLVAFRTDALSGFESASDLEPADAMSVSPTVRTSLMSTAVARPRVVIQSSYVRTPQIGNTAQVHFLNNREIAFRYDHTIAAGNELNTSYGAFFVIDRADSFLLENAHATDSESQPATIRESVIHVLHL